MLVCLTGRLKVLYTEPAGQEVLLAVRGPGDLIGEFSSRDGLPRSATVQAVEPGITSKLSCSDFNSTVRRYGATHQLENYIMGKLRQSAPHAARLAYRTTTPAARLAMLFEEMIAAAGPDHDAPYRVPMSQGELASALQLARSTVTRVIAEWKAANLIKTTRGGVQVIDITTFRRAVQSDFGQSGS